MDGHNAENKSSQAGFILKPLSRARIKKAELDRVGFSAELAKS
jgi:hypothetical protein